MTLYLPNYLDVNMAHYLLFKDSLAWSFIFLSFASLIDLYFIISKLTKYSDKNLTHYIYVAAIFFVGEINTEIEPASKRNHQPGLNGGDASLPLNPPLTQADRNRGTDNLQEIFNPGQANTNGINLTAQLNSAPHTGREAAPTNNALPLSSVVNHVAPAELAQLPGNTENIVGPVASSNNTTANSTNDNNPSSVLPTEDTCDSD